MRKKRSGKIYDEIMTAIRAVDVRKDFVAVKEKAGILATPHLKWV